MTLNTRTRQSHETKAAAVKRGDRFTLDFYRDPKAEWRWRFSSSNGSKTANGGEGYARKASAMAAAAKVLGGTIEADGDDLFLIGRPDVTITLDPHVPEVTTLPTGDDLPGPAAS